MSSSTITGQIRKIALQILDNNPQGVRYSELSRKILEQGNFNKNTISGATWDLDATFPDKVYKPDRGLFRLLKFKENVSVQPDEQPGPKQSKPKAIRESKRSDIVPFPTEIIAAEIKTDSAGLITAFGQACAYKIFSHKSYIVVPADSLYEDITRLDTLCRQFGIGLILFDNTNAEDPSFEIRSRAVKHEPDMFFVNRNLKLIEDKLFK